LDFALFARLEPDTTVDITQPVPWHHRNKGRDTAWSVTIYEPTPPEDTESTFAITSLGVSLSGNVRVERTRYLKDETMRPDYFGRSVGGEWDFNITPERRQELVDSVAGMLARLTAEIPGLQAAFLESPEAAWVVPDRLV
jgi:hypothetical protein